MPFKKQVVKATITAVEDLLKKKEFQAAGRELQRLIEVGAHQGENGQHILSLCKRLQREDAMPLYGPHSLHIEL